MTLSLAERLKANNQADLPPRVVIYGTSKIGKTTFAAKSPNPVFIPTEDGLSGIPDAVSFPLVTSHDDLMACIDQLLNEEHDFKTVVLDSVDWLEQYIWDHVAEKHNKADIEAFGYGKGYVYATDEFKKVLDRLNELRIKKKMMVILIGHHQIKRYEDPSSEGYDRYCLKLHKGAEGKVQEWADAIGFATYKTHAIREDKGFNNTRVRAAGNGERVLCLEERPSFVAGNRFGLPAEIPLDFNQFISKFL
ncbi:ATP-binding protein [Photobacterium damselae]|uniref:ATP-binding protein n=1 Tax=Photobacterium damselae TaxID=38293 RepID=UPI001F3C409F|nr:ATP-binding protein [Photobacterium damselae]UKA12954.1 ATP-binding protein [Photobacterium damselae subsp. damselae]